MATSNQEVVSLYTAALASVKSLQASYDHALTASQAARRESDEASQNLVLQERIVMRAKEEAAAKARAAAEAVQNASMARAIASLALSQVESREESASTALEDLNAARARAESLLRMFPDLRAHGSVGGESLLLNRSGDPFGLALERPTPSDLFAPFSSEPLFPPSGGTVSVSAPSWEPSASGGAGEGGGGKGSPPIKVAGWPPSKKKGEQQPPQQQSQSQSQAPTAQGSPTSTSTGPSANPVCRDYLNGKCQIGRDRVSCKFYHPLNPPPPEAPPVKTQLCIDFLNNGCNRGDQCKYIHNKKGGGL